jgi:two-component system, chemotaxis family, chemotaxis protein CheY
MARAKRKPNTKKLQGKQILVVEDEPLVSELLTDLLRLYDHPSQANSGKDALEQIKHRAPDVILLDLNLPDMNGLEIAKFVRRNEKTSHIPILAMSGDPMDKSKCLEMGCNDFIQKPFTVATLLVRLSELTPPHSRRKKCPVIVNHHPCGMPLFWTGTLDEALKPSFDVYECARGHQTYHVAKTKS